MKKYLTKNNMRESLREVMNKNEITVEAFEDFVNEAYAYAVECNSSKGFTEKASVMLLKKYMKVNLDAFIEVWSILAMYCFENLANKLVNAVAVIEDDKEEMKCIALSTIIDAARLYNFDNEYRRMYELSVEEMTVNLAPKASKLITYAAVSIHNNLKRFNRESHPIHVPDKLAQQVAVIAEILEEHDYDISTKEIEILLQEKEVEASHKTVQALETVCRIERSLNSPVTHGELKNVPDPDGTPADIITANETANAIVTEFPKVTAEVYGYESAYVAQMRVAGMSFYKMEVPFRRFRMINQYLDDVAAENNEILPMINDIKLSICTYGEKGALSMVTSPMASQYLSSAINHANALNEEIERGERTVKECIGSECPAGSLNYMFTKMFHKKKGEMSASNIAKSKEYRKALKDAGLEFLATAIAAKI